ncbi:MAG: hypothetical protein WCJ86_03175 [Candidatus Saccharibacteria bacterium]
MSDPENSPSSDCETGNPIVEGDKPGAMRRFANFTLLRSSATVEWIGGAIGGNALVEQTGINRWAGAAIVAGTIAGLEYPQTSWAAKKHKDTAKDPETNKKTSNKLIVEATSFGQTVWQGAAATVAYNETVGIESTVKRRAFQSLAYGAAVGLWTTPLPGYRDGAELGQRAISKAIENPGTATAGAIISSAAVFGLYEAINKKRQRNNNI